MDQLARALQLPALQGYVAKRLGSEAAEDLLQDVFVGLAQSGRRPTRGVSLNLYVRGAARHQIFHRFEKSARERELFVPLQAAAEARAEGEALDRLLARERRRILVERLRELTPLQREILRRFYFAGEAHEDIERELGITPTRFRLQKSIALRRLRALCSASLAGERKAA
jgi:RNA polymerase sigma factor (sigma-70 family)